MVSYLTDCPHREKLPWLEQLHLMFGSLQYTFDMFSLYEKMLDDMAMAQLPMDWCPTSHPNTRSSARRSATRPGVGQRLRAGAALPL